MKEVYHQTKRKFSNFIYGIFTSILLIFLPSFSIAQITKEQVPDGTEGEVFRSKTKDTLESQKKFPHWNEFDGSLSTLKLGMGLLYDYAGFIQDNTSKNQVELSPEFDVRDFRLLMSGKFKFEREVTWKAGLMYDGDKKSWFARESGVMAKFPELSGYIFFGRTKEGFSISKVMNGYSLWQMERAMHIDIIPILADGIKYLGYFPKQKLITQVGIFTNWLSEGQGFSTYEWQIISRIAFLPIYVDDQKPVLHIGINYRFGKPNDKSLIVRSRPEVNEAPYFVNTGEFAVQNSNHIGGELYYRTGPLLIGTEFNFHMMNSPSTNNPIFKGGEIFINYVLTGEVRPYMAYTGIFTFLNVKKPVFDGGPGAWELSLRFSAIDLDSGTLIGGKFWRISPTANWHLSKNMRLVFSYGYGILKTANETGGTNFFQTRILFLI